VSDALERKIEGALKRTASAIWALVVVGFSAGVWATSHEFRLKNVEARLDSNSGRMADMERSIQRIEFYVQRIASKVGVDVEPPR